MFSDDADDFEPVVRSYPAPSRALPIVSSAVDPSFYGLSHYSARHHETEGLSDITEEDSNLSVTSAGAAGDGAASPIRREPLQGFGVAGDVLRALISDREAQWQQSLRHHEELGTDEPGQEDAPSSSHIPDSHGRLTRSDPGGATVRGTSDEEGGTEAKPKGDVWW